MPITKVQNADTNTIVVRMDFFFVSMAETIARTDITRTPMCVPTTLMTRRPPGLRNARLDITTTAERYAADSNVRRSSPPLGRRAPRPLTANNAEKPESINPAMRYNKVLCATYYKLLSYRAIQTLDAVEYYRKTNLSKNWSVKDEFDIR